MDEKQLKLEIANEERKIKNIRKRIKSLQKTIEKKLSLIKLYKESLKKASLE